MLSMRSHASHAISDTTLSHSTKSGEYDTIGMIEGDRRRPAPAGEGPQEEAGIRKQGTLSFFFSLFVELLNYRREELLLSPTSSQIIAIIAFVG